MDLHWLLLLSVVATCTSALSAVAGFGGGVVLLAVLLQFMPPAQAIPVHGLIQLASNAQRAWLFRQHIHWPIVWRFFALLPLGIALGRLAFDHLERSALETLIASFLLLAMGLRRLTFLQGRDLPPNAFFPIGAVMGVMNMLVGAVAPLLSILIARKGLVKEGQVGSVAMCSFSGHLAKVVAFAVVGFVFQDFAVLFAVLMPAVLLGGWLGKVVLGRMREHVFKQLVIALILVLSLKLIFGEQVLAWLQTL